MANDRQSNGSMLNFSTYQPVYVGRPIEQIESTLQSLSEKNKQIAGNIDAVDLALDSQTINPGDEQFRTAAKDRVRSGISEIMDSDDYSFIEGKVGKIAKDVYSDKGLNAAVSRTAGYNKHQEMLDQAFMNGNIDNEMYRAEKRKPYIQTQADEFGNYNPVYQTEVVRPKMDVDGALKSFTSGIAPEFLKSKGIEVSKNADGVIEYIDYSSGKGEELSYDKVQGILKDYIDSGTEIGGYLDDYFTAVHKNKTYDENGVEMQPSDSEIKTYKDKLLEPYINSIIYQKDLNDRTPGNLLAANMAELTARKTKQADEYNDIYSKYETTDNVNPMTGRPEIVNFTLGNVNVEGNERINADGSKRNKYKLDDKLETHRVITPTIATGMPGVMIPPITYDKTDSNSTTMSGTAYEIYDYNNNDVVNRNNKTDLDNISKALYGEDVTFDKLYDNKDLKDAIADFQKSSNLEGVNLKLSNDGSRIVASITDLTKTVSLLKGKDGKSRGFKDIPLNEILNQDQLKIVKQLTKDRNKQIDTVISKYDSRDVDIANTVGSRYSNIKDDATKMSYVELRTKSLFGTTNKAADAQVIKQGTKFLDTDTGEVLNDEQFQTLLTDSKGDVEVIGDYGYKNNFVELANDKGFSEGELVTLNGKQYAMSTESGSQDKQSFKTSNSLHSIERTKKYEGVPSKLEYEGAYGKYGELKDSTVESENTNANGRTFTVNIGERDKKPYLRAIANIAVNNQLEGSNNDTEDEYTRRTNLYMENPNLLFEYMKSSGLELGRYVNENGFKVTSDSEEDLLNILNITYLESAKVLRKYNNINNQ